MINFDNNHQKLIDITFEIALVVKRYHETFKSDDDLMNWVTNQLKDCGFPTKPCGASWGVLSNE